MSQKDMRLRLVVCRNSLPDTNVVWSVSLETNPTIAKLLEQVNDIFPLESGEWGLEDYAVELRDASGSSFECLHFQPIRGVLKEDDQVFIRPLFTDDLRRRRVGGRLQISTDGKHLIDGIAFGRPLLKTPRGRPALDIPPRKRRRIAQDEEEEQDEDDEGDGDFEPADDEQMLLLTNGEEESGDEYPSSVRIGALFDNIDADEDDADAEMDDEADDQDFETEGVQQETSEESGSDEDLDDDDMLDGEEEEDLEEELRHLQNESAALGEFEEEPPVAASRASTRRASGLDLKTLDKIGALRAAFPSAPSFVCEKILGNCEGDLKAAYSTLVEGFTPNLPESALMARPQKGAMKVHSEDGEAASSRAAKQKAPGTVSKSSQSKMSAPQPAADDDEEGGSDEEEMEGVPDFVKQFDHKGLPPGSISSGTALKAMAKISGSFRSNQLSGESQATSEALVGSKQGFEAANRNDDDETSSSGTSSSSDDVEEDSDDSDSSDEDVSSGSDEDHEQDDNGASNASEGNSGSGSDSSDDDSSDESDSGPEEITAKDGGFVRTRRSGQADHASSSKGGSEASSSSDDESDVTNDTSSSEESSEDDSSDAESSSASESEKVVAHHSKSRGAAALKGIGQADLAPSKSQSLSMVWTQPTVPPGEGKSSTKSRNARRRALLKAKKLAAQGEEVSVADTSNADTLGTTVAAFTQEDKKQRDKELFEARRQALLDAIANGGVEVGPGSLALEDQSSVSELSNKRKRDGAASTSATEEVTYTQSPVQEGGEVPEAQKRRRIDLGAGRRMLFGALGLRNPKTKEDEEKLRTKLMKDVKPHVNFRLEQEIAADAQDRSTETNGEETSSQQLTEEDPDAWRDKITYRAVECCQEDVELSEPPFPFVQRWDPQQQGVWFHQNQKKNKRGGAGKKRDRNQAHFYQAGTKRKHHESADYDEGELDEDTGYDTTFNRVGEDTTADIELNYDDVEQSTSDKGNDAAEANQLTDVEDLPPLPKDLALLKALLPGEVQKGMVITWKQFVLSKATNWQPQVSDLTGVVVRIDDDATGLQVLLARRDRDLDRTEKSFDDNGRRVYEKFEVPDMEDDEETGEADEVDEMERQGYRTLAFADMMDPKILQAPLHQDDTNNGDESMVRSIEEEVAEAVVADSQPEDVKIADNGQPGAAKEADDGYVDGDTFEGFEG
ncbi:uncharacterized protein BCR38DRAFT_143772 [Pseudomassariella vexata]|uniref:DUF7357 domain-containing protein n=1 Tax=Pseudomassariella vexata TaxID=1141098 RepID=A0A1Y2EE71_9PEZI|nr:uncharacterized protein BCR38DRAFT_143772 [Pseudomassariella vexata]ORY69095.1 hypothetical protein BCR38DRAFT_143772 [Pseudomassariella vexata]